jgi:hypothetical protein
MFVFLLLIAQFEAEPFETKYFDPGPRTLGERAESLHTFNVLKYELDVTVPMTSRSLSGVNTIICRSRVDGLTSVTLHSYTITIDSVSVDGVSATYATSDETLHIDLPTTYNTGDSFNINVGYHGSWSQTYPQSGFAYFRKLWNSNTLHAMAYTLSEPWDARKWMPCYDEPYDKADYGCKISVTVPDTFIVCANGELTSVTNEPPHSKKFTWEEQYPITTYLMHFAVSRFIEWTDWYYDAYGDSIELTYYVWPEDSAVSDTAFECIPIAMALFDSMYGYYPFDRYMQDAVYPYSVGGMEHQEISTIHRNWVIYKEEGGMAHELAHMWWGDMVTCVDFRNIWLNEGFASYSDANYTWHRSGHTAFINRMVARANRYFEDDSAYRHPIYDPPPGELFNGGHTYYKASWVMHMLRYLDIFDRDTDTTWFKAIAAYRDSFEYGCADTEDLKSIFSAVYGEDLTWFFDEWVYDQGYPIYDIYWVCNPSATEYVTKIEISQIQTDAPVVFHMPVQIMLHMPGSDTLLNLEITDAVEYLEVTVSDSVSSITFDPHTWLLQQHEVHLIDSVPPGVPTLAQVEKSDTHALLTWTSISTDTLGDPEFMEYYAVYRDTVPDFVPGDSLAYVSHPETTYTDSNVLNATTSYFYLVTAIDAEEHESKTSNMGYVFHKTFNENTSATDKNWVSLPWHSNYATISDLVADVCPAGDPLVKHTNLRNDQLYENYLWDDLFSEWTGTDFAITSGRGYEMVTAKDTVLLFAGTNDPAGLVQLNENAGTTDKNWVSIPYNAVYDSVSDITDEYSPAGNPLIKITDLRDDQLFESWLWDDLFTEWSGSNFVIEDGRAYEMVTTTDTTWNPTEFANSGSKKAGSVRLSTETVVHIGSACETNRRPAWALVNSELGIGNSKERNVQERLPKPTAQSLKARRSSHIIRVHVELDDCEDLVFTAYRPDAAYDILTEHMVGSGVAYKDNRAAFWFDAGNFKTPWVTGEEILIIVEAHKKGRGHVAIVSAQLDETVDIQDLTTIELSAIPEPVVTHSEARWAELENEDIIGYSLYSSGMRLNSAIITDSRYHVDRDASLRPVFTGGIETVYSSHGVQSFETRQEIRYAFSILSNPSLNTVCMLYSLAERTPVVISIYDASGRKVRSFDVGSQKPGHYTLLWNGRDEQSREVSTGVYFVRFAAPVFDAQKKVLFVQ